MDLNLSAQDRAFRDRTRAWFQSNVPRRELKTLEERRAWHRTMYEAGYVGLTWPEEYGGRGASPMQQAIVADEMARANAPAPINGLGVGFIGPTIIIHGTEAQKQRYLKKILSAEEIWCQLYSEPNSGSDLASLRTRADDTGDHFLVNGQKIWTSGGHISDWGILLARTDPAVAKHKGISCFLFNMRQPGVEVRPLKQITGSAEFNEVFMTNARAAKGDLIGRLGQGWEIAQTTLGFERGGNTLARVTRHQANMQRLIDITRLLSRDSVALLEDPVARQKLGRMIVDVEVLRYAGYRILSKLEQGTRPGSESSVDKLYYSEMDKRHQELVQDILGPYGQLEQGLPAQLALNSSTLRGDDSTWAYNFLWSRAGTIYAGSSEIQKNIIGERVLKLPREPRADRPVSSKGA